MTPELKANELIDYFTQQGINNPKLCAIKVCDEIRFHCDIESIFNYFGHVKQAIENENMASHI